MRSLASRLLRSLASRLHAHGSMGFNAADCSFVVAWCSEEGTTRSLAENTGVTTADMVPLPSPHYLCVLLCRSICYMQGSLNYEVDLVQVLILDTHVPHNTFLLEMCVLALITPGLRGRGRCKLRSDATPLKDNGGDFHTHHGGRAPLLPRPSFFRYTRETEQHTHPAV